VAIVRTANLRSGGTQSCGCLKKVKMRAELATIAHLCVEDIYDSAMLRDVAVKRVLTAITEGAAIMSN
jgi:hypothetical protein